MKRFCLSSVILPLQPVEDGPGYVLDDSDSSWAEQDDICSLCQRRFEEQGRSTMLLTPKPYQRLLASAFTSVIVGCKCAFAF
ncbi:hypothetical protein J6590_035003 [Homalodisca vitripennis]|nr:hypothetical protein J6590_035003 [Homalodisca vitripennis]